MKKGRPIPALVFALCALAPVVLAQEAPDPFLLPTARNVWAVLESQEPGVVSDRVDVGGLRGSAPAKFGGFGNTWTQNRFTFGSLDVTDPFSGGIPLIDPEFGFLGGISVFPAEHDASVGTPGILVSLRPRSPGRPFHAGADLYYTDGNFQSRSLAEQERESSISSPEHFGRQVQASAYAAGALSPDGPEILAAISNDRLSRYPENVSRSIRSDRVSGFLSLAQERSGHALKLVGLLQQKHDPALGTSDLQPSGSALDAIRTAGLAALTDSMTLDPSQSLDARLGYVGASFQDRFPSGAKDQSALELFRGTISGAAPLATDGRRERFEASGTWRRALRPGFDLEAGTQWQENFAQERSRAVGNADLQFLNEQPFAVALFDEPGRSRQRIRDVSLFVQATARPNSHLLVSAGLRLESSFGWLPGISGRSIRWTTLSPRIAATETPGEHWRFRASYARYAHALLASELAVFDPRGVSGRVALWNDANGDLQYQPGEEGQVLRAFGGKFSSVDPHLRPPVTDEVAVGTEWHSSRPWVVGVTYRQRYEKHLLETVDTGVPDSSYSPVPYVDPGEDGLVGTGDDQTITVYNQDASTLGRDHFLLTNPAGFRAFYQGLELVTLANDPRGRFRIEASFTAYRIIGSASQAAESLEYDEGVIGNLYDNPNTLIHFDGRLFFDRAYAGKVSALYRFPGDLTAGCVAKYGDGLPFARKVIVTGLNQGPFYVFATQRGNRSLGSDPRNGFRTEYTLTVDLGVEKGVRVAGGRLAFRIDVFNLTNTHKKTRENDLTGTDFQLRIARETEAPRVFRLGLVLAI